jgi:hypothetical protein
MSGSKLFINAVLLLTILLVSCLLEDLSVNVFHDSTSGDNAAESTKSNKNKNAKNDKATQTEYLIKLAASSELKSIAVSKVCGLETEQKMQSMLYTARDRKRRLQRELVDEYEYEGGKRHAKQLKSDFNKFQDATEKVSLASKNIEEWKARNGVSVDLDEVSSSHSEHDELCDFVHELAEAKSAEAINFDFSQESILEELVELDEKIDNYKKRLHQYAMEAEEKANISSDFDKTTIPSSITPPRKRPRIINPN